MVGGGNSAQDRVGVKADSLADTIANRFFLAGVLVGSACGLVLGSALEFELRPDRIRALKRLVRRATGQQERRFDLMV